MMSVVFLLVLSYPLAGLANVSPSSSGSTQEWAYQAIKGLGDDCQIPGFVAAPEMNRSQGALLVARLLQHLSGEEQLESRRFGVSKNVYLDNMIFNYNQRVSPERELDANQVESLYSLVLEFRPELEILGYAIQDFNLLYEEKPSLLSQDSLVKRPLLYSDEAVSAARKQEERKKESGSGIFDQLTQETSEINEPETDLALFAPRNLWTGQFPAQNRSFPSSSSFLLQEPELESPSALQIAGLELSGGIRPLPSGTQALENSPATEGGAGYGLSVKMGDLALKTGLDQLATERSQVTTASVDLSLDWLDLFVLSAGYKQVDVPTDLANRDSDWKEVPPVVTSLGVELPITGGTVRLGMTQEWPKPEGGKILGADLSKSTKSIAELGLNYEFKNESSLRLNYKFIDFRDLEQGQAEVEFSIKF